MIRLILALTIPCLVLSAGCEDVCKRPNCVCASSELPAGLRREQVPQFVMLTFDDAVTITNYPTYQKLLMSGRVNKRNKCPITATFFVTHEYADYYRVHQLWRRGNEIGVHSISHKASTNYWKKASYIEWSDEMSGMRKILSKYAKIPENEIVGHRAPFLQTAGNTTFRMLQDHHFLYDSSMPTRVNVNPPLWPYTLDLGYQQDCQIQPCPNEPFGGLFLMPMVNLNKTLTTDDGFDIQVPCAMADACTPWPETEDETYNYFMNNFERHYYTSRAPFPLFIHEAWLKQEGSDGRKNGYFKFIDDLLKKDDVFIVNMKEVIEYVRNPVSVTEYQQKFCHLEAKPDGCPAGRSCSFKNTPVGGGRIMNSCSTCPPYYPWVGQP